jgi:hypothetical protein
VPGSSKTTLPRRRALLVAFLACAVLALGQSSLWLGIEPFATWSYALSWWSTIFLLDALVCLRVGESLALARPRAFLALAFWSGAFWLAYEAANLRLSNWYYVGIPPDLPTRTLGVFVSFATVLPGVLGVHAFLESRAATRLAREPRAPRPGTQRLLFALGAASLVLPLAFPRVAYPLIWGAAFLLIEPWLATRDPRSLLARWCGGDRAPLGRLLLAGAACGLLWETWNFRSPAKWIYTVPFFEDAKLFEMPYLGFVGFMPFALGCHSAARALVALGWMPEWEGERLGTEPPRPRRARTARAAWVVAILFSAWAIAALNRSTVRATRPAVADLPGIPAEFVGRFARAGIAHPDQLARWSREREPAIDLEDADPEALHGWIETARLMSVRGLGLRGYTWLADAGVRTVEALAASDAEALLGQFSATRRGLAPEPTAAEVRVWIRGARRAQG